MTCLYLIAFNPVREEVKNRFDMHLNLLCEAPNRLYQQSEVELAQK